MWEFRKEQKLERQEAEQAGERRPTEEESQ